MIVWSSLKAFWRTLFVFACIVALFYFEYLNFFRNFSTRLQRVHRHGALVSSVISLEERFKMELEAIGTKLYKLRTGGEVAQSKCVMVAATGANYSWTREWAEARTRQKIPFVLLELSGIRNGELKDVWARVPALIATYRVLAQADILVYTDIDMRVQWPLVCHIAGNKAMTISWKWTSKKHWKTLDPNWFVIRASHPKTENLLHSWYYSGRDVFMQSRTVLNELYRRNWVRESVEAIYMRSWKIKQLVIGNCRSSLGDNRKKCMRMALM